MESPQTTSSTDRASKADRVVRRRQDPVSCRLCRLKKLKCNRQHPCSNCIARRASCEFEPSNITNHVRLQQETEPSNATILSRLQRLEDMILRMGQNFPTTPESASSRKQETDIIGLSPATNVTDSAHQIETEDLTTIGIDSTTQFPALSCAFTFDMVPFHYILKHEIDQPYSSSSRQRRILLPPHKEARNLLDQYRKYVCHFHHIIHLPSLRKTLEDVYYRLSTKEPVGVSHILLLISIFSTVLCYTTWSEKNDVLVDVSPQVSTDREAIFMYWFRCALDLLDHCRRVLPGDLEVVQAAIIVVFLDYNLEGFTPRARSVLAQALQTARDLGMHRTDCPSSIKRRQGLITTDSIIETEVKRRIWWHLAATDWMISLAGGSQEGTYSAHPNQMRVRLPRNIDDDVLERGNITEDLPPTSPTTMCYPLQRIRLAEIMRTVVDTMRFSVTDPTEHDYLQILAVDKRIEHFLEDLPVFLRLDDESIHKSQYTLERYPHFAMQRFIINIGAQSARCKLHQPFLVRGEGQQRYPHSVETCLGSAMEVIKINQAVRRNSLADIPTKVKLVGLLHHVFLATVVLVMDLCFNKMTNTADPRAADVMTAIEMLKEAKTHSASAQRFLETLMDALQKHQVRLVTNTSEERNQHTSINMNQDMISLGRSGVLPLAIQTPNDPYTAPTPQQFGTKTTALGYDDMWKEALTQGDMLSMPDWDSLFSELDAFIA